MIWKRIVYKVKLATLVEGDPKAHFSMATTLDLGLNLGLPDHNLIFKQF